MKRWKVIEKATGKQIKIIESTVHPAMPSSGWNSFDGHPLDEFVFQEDLVVGKLQILGDLNIMWDLFSQQVKTEEPAMVSVFIEALDRIHRLLAEM